MEKQKEITYDSMDVVELCNYLTENHHSLERKLMSEIKDHIEVVLKVEKNRLGQMPFVRDNFLQMAWKLEQHIAAEEQIIFPFAEKFAKQGRKKHLIHFPELRHIIDMLVKLVNKQKSILESMEAIRNLTHHFNAEVKDSPSHKLCLDELHRLDLNIQQHFFIESNVLVKKMEHLEDIAHVEENEIKNEG